MSVIFILIPLSILIAACFLAALIWAVRSGQYEDTTTPPMRVLLDDAAPAPATNKSAEHRPARRSASAEPCSALQTATPPRRDVTSA